MDKATENVIAWMSTDEREHFVLPASCHDRFTGTITFPKCFHVGEQDLSGVTLNLADNYSALRTMPTMAEIEQGWLGFEALPEQQLVLEGSPGAATLTAADLALGANRYQRAVETLNEMSPATALSLNQADVIIKAVKQNSNELDLTPEARKAMQDLCSAVEMVNKSTLEGFMAIASSCAEPSKFETIVENVKAAITALATKLDNAITKAADTISSISDRGERLFMEDIPALVAKGSAAALDAAANPLDKAAAMLSSGAEAVHDKAAAIDAGKGGPRGLVSGKADGMLSETKDRLASAKHAVSSSAKAMPAPAQELSQAR